MDRASDLREWAGLSGARWNLEGPAVASKSYGIPAVRSGTTSWERDFHVDRAGNVYTKHAGKTYHGRMRVDKYDRDGKFVGTLIWVVSDGAYASRVDAAGNLCIAEALKPVGERLPEFFRGGSLRVRRGRRQSAGGPRGVETRGGGLPSDE